MQIFEADCRDKMLFQSKSSKKNCKQEKNRRWLWACFQICGLVLAFLFFFLENLLSLRLCKRMERLFRHRGVFCGMRRRHS